MRSRNILALVIQAVITLTLAGLLPLTVQARGGDDPPKIDPRPVSDVVSDSLFKLGCKRFLGRPDDYLCKTREAIFTCEAFKKDGKAGECRRAQSGPPRILPPATDAEIARSSLLKLGSKLFLGRPDEFICDTREERLVCGAFEAAGLVKTCHVPGKSN